MHIGVKHARVGNLFFQPQLHTDPNDPMPETNTGESFHCDYDIFFQQRKNPHHSKQTSQAISRTLGSCDDKSWF